MKLEVPKQAEKFAWWEDHLRPGVFHVEIMTADEEAAARMRKYLPLVERFLVNGFQTKNQGEGGD